MRSTTSCSCASLTPREPIPRVDQTTTVNDVLRHHPATASVFSTFGIDACCGGARSLADAASEDGADLTALLAALEWAAYGDGTAP